MVGMAVPGNMKLSSSQQQGLVFGGAFLVAGIVLSTMVFPFWHLIREDVFEDVIILSNDDGTCYVETIDSVPKIIDLNKEYNLSLKRISIGVVLIQSFSDVVWLA